MILNEKTKIVLTGYDDCSDFAYEFLCKYLEEIFGKSLTYTGGSVITFITDKDLGKEEYRVAWQGEQMTVSGGSERAVLYGVIGLLTDKFGCRFYASDTEYVPHMPELDLGETGEFGGKPSFEYRTPLWHCAYDPDWAIKNRTNGNPLSEKRGGYVKYSQIAHTYSSLVPHTLFDEHPEYFMMENGVRIPHQLCLTNPDTVNVAVENARKLLRNDPTISILSVTQDDGYKYCHCPECEAEYEREGSPAGLSLRFANRIAEALEDEFPDVMIDTFAYVFTRHAPKFERPHKNVTVRLCSFECCYSHPFEDCRENGTDKSDGISFMDDLKAWAAISPKLYVWNYTTCFANYHTMFPNYYNIAKNYRTLYKNNVRGIFDEGEYQTVSGEFAELRAYLTAQLMWNIDADEDGLIADFMRNYYGAGWGYIKEFMDICAREVSRPDCHMGIYNAPSLIIKPEDEKLAHFVELWDKAERGALNELQRDHVRRSRIQLEYYLSSVAKFTPEENLKLHEKMVHYGINRICESYAFSDETDFSKPADTWRLKPTGN